MKREHINRGTARHDSMGYGKMAALKDPEMDAGMDELLAVLGYKLRYSDMEDVAQKLEQLDRAMGISSTNAQEDHALISHLASDAVHYNPSDLSGWVENMMSEMNNPNAFDLSPPAVDLSALIPRGSEQEIERGTRDRKRMRTSSSSSSFYTACRGDLLIPPSIGRTAAFAAAPIFPIVMLDDSQEAGICLVHALLACAEAVHQENYKSADAIMKQISVLTSSQRGAIQKVSGYFAEALSRRIYRFPPNQDSSLDSAFSDILQMHFYESCPYLKFAHFTANQAILEAFTGFRRVHVIDFGMKQGMQWPALMQALALRSGGPPSFRLTGIGPPQTDNSDALRLVGWKLSQLAETLNIDFEFRGLVANSIADIEPYMLESGSAEQEAVAINAVFELHNLLAIPEESRKFSGRSDP
ncbi:DELLA protein GAI1 [Platanthera guangdongensis]|uniref:DELLA protein n=1 Tax=Platanthera guangdongensis TaxID=2320717 RepID=A0ABR2LJ61_9ASPA